MNLLNVFILSFGALQGLLLCALLLRKNVFRTAYLFLLLYLLTLLLQTVLKIVSKIWLMENTPFLYGVSYHLPFLYGPLLYFFVLKMDPAPSGTYKNTRMPAFFRAYIWHLLPFLFFISIGYLVRVYPHDLIRRLFYFFGDKIIYVQLLSLLCYHLYGFQWLSRKTEPYHKVQLEKRRWLKRYAMVSLVVTTSIAIGLYLIFLSYPRYSDMRFLFGAITLYIYWLSYEALYRPEMIYPAPAADPARVEVRNGGNDAVSKFSVNARKYHHSTLTQTETEAIMTTLQLIMQHRRPYLEPDLTLDDLAALADTSRHHLSQVINGDLQKNFYEYLNDYRVKAAAQLLSNPAVDHLKIAAIAYDSGFQSLSTFNEVFKKATGQTPSEFRKCRGIPEDALPSGSDR